MLLKCRKLEDGPGPSEIVVEIIVEDGTEEVVVFDKSVKHDALEVGQIVGTKPGFSLVELPREASSGKWRVWVPAIEVAATA